MLEAFANLFYDPWVFWGTPIVLAVGRELVLRLRRTR